MRKSTKIVKATPALGTAGAKQAKRSNVATPANKPAAKRASTPAKPTEATPDPRAAKAIRVAAERETVANIFAAFDAASVSIPVKPLSAFKPASSHAHPIKRNPSVRQAAAIAVLFGASAPGKKLADGASAPRVFEYNGVRYAAENGVLADAISAGLITVSGATPETETIKLRAGAASAITGLCGAKALGKLAA